MKIIRKIRGMRKFSRGLRAEGKTIAVVPTMGCLHAGHLALVKAARKYSDSVIVTIFVNPIQFGPKEDFRTYPRPFRKDVSLCRKNGVSAVFAPSAAEMYKPDASTVVEETKLSRGLCGRSRPGHFRGVATVVAKLLNATLPDIAVFGKKDYQQVQVVRRMVEDLDFPVKIVAVPTVREKDGLAMSSRNAYLPAAERAAAASIREALKSAKRAVMYGERNPRKIKRTVSRRISAADGRMDYVEVVDAKTLSPVKKLSGRILIAAAAFFGKARLIDNIELFLPG